LRRYTNWSLILVMGILAVAAITSRTWIPEIQPSLVSEPAVERFACPRFVTSEQCDNLRRINDVNPQLAENLREGLDPDNDLETLEEPTIEQLATDLNPNTSDEPQISRVKVGTFSDIDIIRTASGEVGIYEIIFPNDPSQAWRYLSFGEEFRVISAADLRVYLSSQSNPNADNPEGVFEDEPLEVALLKGNIGNQNFELDRSLDLNQYRSVVIYSEEYDIIVATAPIVTN
jgi:hypothetical protein